MIRWALHIWATANAWLWLPTEKYALFRKGFDVSHERDLILPLIPVVLTVTREWGTEPPEPLTPEELSLLSFSDDERRAIYEARNTAPPGLCRWIAYRLIGAHIGWMRWLRKKCRVLGPRTGASA